ncbi:MAG TPA: SPOR domain-containing protein [Campylobacterales bacterium]|nr:SPOR domain-containing protein [Campylobacterales bacterium]
MAEKNLHNIKIDDLDSPKKTPLKNILTLLALLFIILVISVVITKLILNTDEGSTIENNDSKSELLNDVNKTTDADAKSDTAKSDDTSKKDESSDVKVPVLSNNIVERNLTSVIKTPLTSHVPKKEPKEIKTYSAPKKNTEPKKASTTPKQNTTPKKVYVAPKKEYIDKVVAKKNTTSSTHSSSTKKASFLGGQRKDVTNSYYIKVGTYRDATTVINKVKKNNFNYALVKVENDKTLLRVLVGPFFSRNQANAQLAKVKANILTGAYVTKAK